MAFGDTAKLIAELALKDAGFTQNLKGASKALGSFDAKLADTQTRAYKAGQQIGTGIKNAAKIAAVGVGLLATQVIAGANSLINLEKVTSQTEAALASTHGISGETAGSIRDLANEFENLNAQVDDTVIQAGANVLLTFTNIRQQAFKPALEAALNLSQAMGSDLQGAIVQVGKALNDPAKGLTALSKVGVTFTKAQKDQINALLGTGKAAKGTKVTADQLAKAQERLAVAELALTERRKKGKGTASSLLAAENRVADTRRTLNDLQTKSTAAVQKSLTPAQKQANLLKAQGIILAELGTEFGGSFAKAGQTTAGKFASVGDAVEDLQRSLATALLPSLGKVAVAVKKALTDPAVQRGVTVLGDNIAALFSDANLATGAKILQDTFKIAKDVAPAIQSAAEVTGQVVKTSVDLFRSLPPGLQTLLVGGLALNKLTGGLVTNLAGGLISAVVGQLKSAVVNIAAANVNVVGGGGVPPIKPPVGPDLLPGAAGIGLSGVAVAAGLVAVPAAAIALQAANVRPNEEGATVGPGGQKGHWVSGKGGSVFVPLSADEKARLQAIVRSNDRQTNVFSQDFGSLKSATAAAAARTVAAASATTRAIKDLDLGVHITNQVIVPVKTVINGRLVDTNLNRYVATVGTGPTSMGGP